MSGVHIHPMAHVQGATVGLGSRIWQFASVIRGAVVGAGCNVGSCAIVDGARVGDFSTIGHGVSLNPGIVVGDHVFIGPNVTFCNDLWPSTSKRDFEIGPLLSGEMVTTIVRDNASVGAGATVLPGVIIGAGSMVSAGAVVCRSVPDGHLLRRDGGIEPIDEGRAGRRRMIAAA